MKDRKGKNNPNWKGGITKDIHKYRPQYHQSKIKENSNYNKENYKRNKDNPAYKLNHRKSVSKYDKTNPAKSKARHKAKRTIPLNSMCVRCNFYPAKHRHHPDYSKPLEVMLLCVKCHQDIHKPKIDVCNHSWAWNSEQQKYWPYCCKCGKVKE